MGLDLVAIIAFLGPLGLMGAFIFFMINKKGWSWAQFVTTFIFTMIVAAAVPHAPQAFNDGVMGVVQSFVK